MTAAEKIYELVKALPEAEVGKVLVFVIAAHSDWHASQFKGYCQTRWPAPNR
jgi:hypothetical protein